MFTYPNTTLGLSDNNYGEPSCLRFPWFPPGSHFPAAKVNFDLFQRVLKKSNPAINAVPISSVKPVFEPIRLREFVNACGNKKKKQPKIFSPKQKKKSCPAQRKAKKQPGPGANCVTKNLKEISVKAGVDLSKMPSPFCSCTGVARGCYKWGSGGWQSSCCNAIISEHPLPMSSTRPGVRVAGRKMSDGAFGKLMNKLGANGYDFSQAIDLKNHWAKHGTNKYVTIR